MEPDGAGLADWLRRSWAAEAVAVDGLAPLSGGAIQENWRLDADVRGGAMAGRHALVLRLDAPSSLAVSHGRAAEFRLLAAAADAGVPAPEPLALCEDACIIGRPFFVMRRLAGSADPRALTRTAPHPGLVRALGAALARLHTVVPPRADFGFLAPPAADAARGRVTELRALLDGLGAAEPGLEWGLAWLHQNAPPPVAPVLCHRDFRTGNLLVEDGALRAVLDWEFAGWSDPAEDLGWISAPCWRFRRPDLEAGGLGTLDALIAGYRDAGGAPPARARIRYWQVMGVARWAVIALGQAARHRSGAEPSLELALTGHLVPELTLELLDLTAPE